MHIWVSQQDDPAFDQEAYCSELSRLERARLTEIKNPASQREYLHSRWLMKGALAEVFGGPPHRWVFGKGVGAKPVVDGMPSGWSFSLSHSNGMVAFSLARTPHGVDIEWTEWQRNLEVIAKRVYCPNEQDFVSTNSEVSCPKFYRVWCAKEAWYKALSVQDQRRVSLRDLSYFQLLMEGCFWQVFELEIGRFQLSLVSRRGESRPDVRMGPTVP